MTRLLSLICFLAITPLLHSQATLKQIRSNGKLRCAVDFEQVEYSTEDAHGNHSLFDLELCKAVAVASLGPAAKFDVIPFRDESDALKGLKAGEADVLATASLNYMNLVSSHLAFTSPVFFDRQGFLVNHAAGIHSAQDLRGRKVCFIGGTELEIQLTGFMERSHINFLPFSFQEEGEMEAAFITGNCAAITADISQLAFERIAFKTVPTSFDILPDTIAEDPLAIAYRPEDQQWSMLLSTVVSSLLQAEASGITQANVLSFRNSTDPVIQRLLGTTHGYGQYLGLPDSWLVPVLQAVGNYGELFDRTLGDRSVMKLQRGPNNLASNGGLMSPTPIR